jgi:hypothetical protein
MAPLATSSTTLVIFTTPNPPLVTHTHCCLGLGGAASPPLGALGAPPSLFMRSILRVTLKSYPKENVKNKSLVSTRFVYRMFLIETCHVRFRSISGSRALRFVSRARLACTRTCSVLVGPAAGQLKVLCIRHVPERAHGPVLGFLAILQRVVLVQRVGLGLVVVLLPGPVVLLLLLVLAVLSRRQSECANKRAPGPFLRPSCPCRRPSCLPSCRHPA